RSTRRTCRRRQRKPLPRIGGVLLDHGRHPRHRRRTGHALSRAATEPPTAIITRNLTKRFGDRVAVAELSVDISSGVTAGFIGPNGAGKTTTLGMLLGLLRPSTDET